MRKLYIIEVDLQVYISAYCVIKNYTQTLNYKILGLLISHTSRSIDYATMCPCVVVVVIHVVVMVCGSDGYPYVVGWISIRIKE